MDIEIAKICWYMKLANQYGSNNNYINIILPCFIENCSSKKTALCTKKVT